MKRLCRWCGSGEHTQFYCRRKPRTPIKQRGKQANKWTAHRAKLMKDNKQEWFVCWICTNPVHRSEVTFDHVLPRSHAPELRYDNNNIKPAHGWCNSMKGSKHE